MNNRVYQYLSEGGTLLTYTQRLARYLRHQFGERKRREGELTWETPAVLTWTAWCQHHFQQLTLARQETRFLLSDMQQRWLWREIIEQSPQRERILQVDTTVDQAIDSYRLCREWDVPIFPDGVYLNDDAFAFKQWVERYEAQKEKDQLLDETDLPDLLIAAIGEQQIPPEDIAVYGFHRFTAQQTRLLDALKTKAEVTVIDIEERNQSVAVLNYENAQEEWRAAAAWARGRLEQQPDARIGVVAFNLSAVRTEAAQAFDAVLGAGLGAFPDSARHQSYAIAVGESLSAYPLVETALNILSFSNRAVDAETLRCLLHSPFIKGHERERYRRARFDFWLNEQRISEWDDLKQLCWLHDKKCPEGAQCAAFIKSLTSLMQSAAEHTKKATPQQWALVFSEWLGLFGWPGQRDFSGAEQQTVTAFRAALGQLSSLSPISTRIARHEALHQLHRIVSETRFQPETEETPVQIMGAIGTAGMQFDDLWVIGAQDDLWPGKALVDPFIPRTCQKEYQLPGTTAEAQYAEARRMTDDLHHSAETVTFSFHRHDGDRDCRPSPLIKSYPQEKKPMYLGDYPDYRQVVFSSARPDRFVDPILGADRLTGKITGGSAIFKDQAACPFRAFARHRLKARTFEEVDIGPNAMDRGILAHAAMQFLWDSLKSLKKLRSASNEDINAVITAAVDKAIKDEFSPKGMKRFVELEKDRLRQLLRDWLEIEDAREVPFKVIETEQKREIEFAGIALTLYIDRIDELKDGKHLIIDYKTGRISERDWDGENPRDPQLPLYAVTSDAPVAGLAFAGLKRGEMGFKGYTAEDGTLPSVGPNKSLGWEEQFEEWKTVLTGLAEDFLDGKHDVDPTTTACEYCDLPALCRIDERETDDED